MFGLRWGGPDSSQKRDKPSLLPEETIDISADVTAATAIAVDADYSTSPLKGLYVGGAGTVYVRRVDDVAGKFVPYVMTAGGYIYGLIATIGATGAHLTTATALVGER